MLFQLLDERWGPHTIDRFATANNAHCRRYNSRWRDPTSEGVDAMARNWRAHPHTGALERNWVNPPWDELPLCNDGWQPGDVVDERSDVEGGYVRTGAV